MNKNQRRKFLKTSLLSGGAVQVLPDKWLNPVINSVIMPSHAQTSDDTDLSPDTGTVSNVAINPNCDNVVVSSEFDNSTRLSTVSVSGRVLAVPGLADLSGVVIMVEYTPNNESGDSATQEIQTNADGSFQTTFTGTEEQVYQADLMLLRVADEFKANNPDVIAELDTAQCLGNRPADLAEPPAPPTPTSAPPAPPTPTSAPPAPPTPTSAPPAPPTPTSAPPAPPDEVGPPAPLVPPPGPPAPPEPPAPPGPPAPPAPPPGVPEFVPVLGE